MLTQEYRRLIQVLIEKTDNGAISWKKGESRFSYRAKGGENTFKVDKYFAGDHNDACLNLSTYDKNGDLVLEIVLCKGIGEQLEDYEFLGLLYSRVEQRVNKGNIQQEIPIVTSIIQSLQQV
jgi:hypothetical protein